MYTGGAKMFPLFDLLHVIKKPKKPSYSNKVY
jgi:hypothetical protein